MSQVSHPNDAFDYMFKVILIGDSGVGKSSLLARYSRNVFSTETKTTIGVEFANSLITHEDKRIKVIIWDTAGQERFKSATGAYYRNTLGAFLVYDITSRTSFNNVTNWLKELNENVNNDNVSLTLVGNKCDLRHLRAISKDEAAEFAKSHGMKFMETSALDAVNIEPTFKEMINEIYNKICLEEEQKEESMRTKTINLTLTSDDDNKGCCITN